ncbi:Sulfite reductase [ferredoxin] [Paraburkholderia domus]|uniref:nitrite/sulfite reductase n=1 Tax=Paraburkholderia domus TaxID=2793075 RepID=UPI0019121D50|nr:nitrite/sulfite reductase [Paraburkholderia domus]MBK5052704.1 nitrite/sulfite reductase [Burkholderia sp. R-70006]MBK5064746.1 nitrite/sulfite reductase [Burkholderia sp. R-70199]MBK5089496.1 nitrite/sulfite reductase [Burkholderia sp. R-69927]MBK5125810.1 nitrite/sulfite reductase [Burkholderia sp. R-69980]MBK5184032.1 nitrite/sulfite reductase [Burkholderia sp. R-69749]
MYEYDNIDRTLVLERVEQFRDQVARRMSGELSEEEFLPLRLQNGLYMQKHAYMLRVAIPYGTLSANQLRKLAHIARTYDRGYGHFTTRQNIQFNWIKLEETPTILEELATVNMHAIQTSGNCVRNITTEQFAGVAADEILDPRPLAEILRQWSTLNPEFAYLPRKFKIAISSSAEDRAAVRMHDIGIYVYRDADGQLMLRVFAGGGLGRTPILNSMLREDLPWQHMLTYVESVLRVYNRYGRRDNKYKARIKILVRELGIERFASEVEEEWAHVKDGPCTLTVAEYERVTTHFRAPAYDPEAGRDDLFLDHVLSTEPEFARWARRNVRPHKVPGYASVVISTKPGLAMPPGDVTADQMDVIANCSEWFGHQEVRVAHEQNLILPDVEMSDLYQLWLALDTVGLATPNIGLITDIVSCPGGDYCSLANAKSIPIAQAIQQRFDDFDFVHDLGEISLNISGCINACGHHHMGNIGVLGVDKQGEEWYQVTLGGAQGKDAAIGTVIGPSFKGEQMPDVVERIVEVFQHARHADESFSEVIARLGITPFKERVYADH